MPNPVADQKAFEHLTPLQEEQCLLGSMMLEEKARERSLSICSEPDLYLEQNRVIFAAMRDMHSRGEPVDLTLLVRELQDTKKLETAGGLPYLASLLHIVPTPAHVDYYARIVRAGSMLRQLWEAGGEIRQMLHGVRFRDTHELLERAEKLISGINASGRSIEGFQRLGDVLDKQFDRMSEQANAGADLTGITTGYCDLDTITNGLQPSDLFILAARPAMGKTSLATGIALAAARSNTGPLALFSLEMSSLQLALRLIAGEARVPVRRLRSPGELLSIEWDRVADAIARMHQLPIWMDDTTDLNVHQVRAKARRLEQEQGRLSLVVVDYLQLLVTSRDTNAEVTEISRCLKSMARDLNCPVIALSQLSRNVERREDKRPILSDLRDSGSIEAEADIVAFVYRPSYYERKAVDTELTPAPEPEPEEAEIIVAKHRQGACGTVRMLWMPDYAQFVSLDDRHAV